MEIRTSKPEKGNKYYTRTASGGYNTCIKGSPTDSCDALANCVGYCEGRFNEIIGSWKYGTLNCNAENFIERAEKAGLSISNVPTLGGIMVWQKGSTLQSSDGAGHVAIVERIDSDTQIYTSESGYGSSAFWNSTRKNTNGRWGMSSSYTFRGCIVNPAIGTSAIYTGTFPTLPSRGYLKKGDTGTQVKYLQKFLNWCISANLDVDSKFGSKTQSAVKTYQKNYSLTVDGYFGPKSLAKAKTIKK